MRAFERTSLYSTTFIYTKQVYCHEINSVFFSLHPKAICIYSLNLNLLSNFKLRHPIELSVRLYESHLKSHNDLRFTSFYFHLRICFQCEVSKTHIVLVPTMCAHLIVVRAKNKKNIQTENFP